MPLVRRTQEISALTMLLSSAALAAVLLAWLWSARPFYVGLVCAALLFGGAIALPSRHVLAHAFSVGLCIGVCIGSAVGILRM